MIMLMRYGFWNNKRYYLNKMTFKQLVAAYFQYYAIQGYILVGLLSGYFAVTNATSWVSSLIVIGLVIMIYPVVWYLLHRFVLHGRYLYKSRYTSGIWKRIHFDHHQDPYDLSVLFGALYTTLPTNVIVTGPVGWFIDGFGGFATAIATAMAVTCFYEFCHCMQHLSYRPRFRWVREIKRHHLAHHFHDEHGNFGITNFLVDKVLGTFYERDERPEKSATVFNLGYDKDEAKIFPWVAELSGGISDDRPRERRRKAA